MHHHVCPSCRGAGTVSAATAAVAPAPRRYGLFAFRRRPVVSAQASSSTGDDDGEFSTFLEAAVAIPLPLLHLSSLFLHSRTPTPMKKDATGTPPTTTTSAVAAASPAAPSTSRRAAALAAGAFGLSSLITALSAPSRASAAAEDDAAAASPSVVAASPVAAEPAKCRECAGTGVTPCDM